MSGPLRLRIAMGSSDITNGGKRYMQTDALESSDCEIEHACRKENPISHRLSLPYDNISHFLAFSINILERAQFLEYNHQNSSLLR
jgi:hypothetical protein